MQHLFINTSVSGFILTGALTNLKQQRSPKGPRRIVLEDVERFENDRRCICVLVNTATESQHSMVVPRPHKQPSEESPESKRDFSRIRGSSSTEVSRGCRYG